jgi:uroporphyrinogen-III synthase
MIPLVIVRPEPGASATAAQARAMGLDARAIPLFDIVPLAWTAPDPSAFDALLLTSANAIRHGGPQLEGLKRLPVHAVGAATAAAARGAGFTLASVGEGGVGDMQLPPGQRLLHLAGRDHRHAATTQAIAIYEARALAPPPELAKLEDCVVAIHSPRAGQRLAQLLANPSRVAIAAISPAAADACGLGWMGVHAAPQPTDSALLALAARLCESHGQ